MKCAYCGREVLGREVIVETRPGRLLRLDGTIVDFPRQFPVCPSCDRRLPTRRQP